MRKTILLSLIIGIFLASFVSAGWFANNFYKTDFTGAAVYQAPKSNNFKCAFYKDQSPTFTSQGVKHECRSVNLKSNVSCTTDTKGVCGGEFIATEGETISWTSSTCKGVAATKIIKGRNNYYANFYNCGKGTSPVNNTCSEGEIKLTNFKGNVAYGANICRNGVLIPAKIIN